MLTHMCYLVLLTWDGIVPTVRRLENLSEEINATNIKRICTQFVIAFVQAFTIIKQH